MKDVLAIQTCVFSADDLEILWTKHGLIANYLIFGHSAEAMRVLKETHSAWRMLLGVTNVYTLCTKRKLSSEYGFAGRLNQVIELEEECLVEQGLGKRH